MRVMRSFTVEARTPEELQAFHADHIGWITNRLATAVNYDPLVRAMSESVHDAARCGVFFTKENEYLMLAYYALVKVERYEQMLVDQKVNRVF